MKENDREDLENGNVVSEEMLQVAAGGRKAAGKRRKSKGRRFAAVALTGFLIGGITGGTAYGVYANGLAQSQNQSQAASLTLNKAAIPTTAGGDTSAAGASFSVVDIVEMAMPSTVSISNKSVQEVRDYFSMFGMRGQTYQEEVESQGTGIIIGQNDTELLIATNEHVVAGADTLSACFVDNEVYEAAIKGTDVDNDLAVIAVKLSDISQDTMSKLQVATIGNSDELRVGEQVVAIGNALGYGQSVTTGIVSALNRQVSGVNSDQGFIQTDAAINPGNSGGALLNMKGEVIGINSAKLASTQVEGMGYAIPISTAAPIMEDLMNIESRDPITDGNTGALGIMAASVTTDMQQLYGIPAGVYISQVNEGEAAEAAGLKKGYIITKFDKTSVTSIEALKERLGYYRPGETVSVTVQVPGENGYEERAVDVTLSPAQTQDQDTQEDFQGDGWYNGGNPWSSGYGYGSDSSGADV